MASWRRDEENIKKMVVALKNCYLKRYPYLKICGECSFEESCRRNYDHYCTVSVTYSLTEADYNEFYENFEKLRLQPNMFDNDFHWRIKELEEVEV